MVQRHAKNLKFRCGTPTETWNKIMVEVRDGRYAGPFDKPPFKNYIQSPVGLVLKDNGKKTHLIFHLSYPRNGDSVNSGIPKQKCTVRYPDFEDAIRLCLAESETGFCHISKSDMSMVFRNVPLRPCDWPLLLLMAKHPLTGKTYYFVDKCLPFGASISCVIFQSFSDSVSHLVTFRTKRRNVNYLDDFFFVAMLRLMCDWQVNTFLQVCQQINFPVSLEKN